MSLNIESYINRQGNNVEIVRNADDSIKSIEVSGSGSNRAFQAQLRAARSRATVVGV